MVGKIHLYKFHPRLVKQALASYFLVRVATVATRTRKLGAKMLLQHYKLKRLNHETCMFIISIPA